MKSALIIAFCTFFSAVCSFISFSVFGELFDSPTANRTMTTTGNGVVVLPSSSRQSSESTPLYSDLAENRPTEDQAIVLDISSGFPNRKYTDALLAHINPSDIKYMSRISGARFCLFLSQASLVKKLVEEVQFLQVEEHQVKIYPLATKAKKVTISNASPVISNSAIKRYLVSSLGVRTSSSVTELKANSGGDKRLAGVGSFRRQIYVHPDDANKIPTNHQFEVNGKKYNVFFSTDKPVCFLCKQAGHFAKNCKNVTQHGDDDMYAVEEEETLTLPAVIVDTGLSPPVADKVEPLSPSFSRLPADASSNNTADERPLAAVSTQCDKATDGVENVQPMNVSLLPHFVTSTAPNDVVQAVDENDKDADRPEFNSTETSDARGSNQLIFNGQLLFAKPSAPVVKDSTKRPRSLSVSTLSGGKDTSDDLTQTKSAVLKKPRKTNPRVLTTAKINEQINIISDKIDAGDKELFPISFSQLAEFVDATVGVASSEVPLLVEKYTDRLAELILMLNAAHERATVSALKSRLTKITNALSSSLKGEEVMELPPTTDGESSDCDSLR